MKALLAIEWLKIKNYKTFWILTGLFIVLLPLWNICINSGMLFSMPGGFQMMSQAYSFPLVWDNFGFWASIFVIFQAILVIILTSNEYQYRTNRQNVIDGWTRMQFYHAKWWLVIMVTLGTTLFTGLLGIAFGLYNGGDFSEVTNHISRLWYLGIICLNYCGFALLLSLLLKRSGFAIGMFLLYCMIIETILHSVFAIRFEWPQGDYFLPLQCSDNLLPVPMLDMAKAMMGMGKEPAVWPNIVASFCWVGVYYIIGRIKLLRSDW